MRMTLASTSAIRLDDAYFCLNCEVVTNSSNFCPVCGHGQLWPLETWLGRVNGHNESQPEVKPGKTGELSPMPPAGITGGGRELRQPNRISLKKWANKFGRRGEAEAAGKGGKG